MNNAGTTTTIVASNLLRAAARRRRPQRCHTSLDDDLLLTPRLLLLALILPMLLLSSLHNIIPVVDAAAKVLVVGATGTTGIRALQGLLDCNYQPSDLILLTRNANQRRILQLKGKGFQILQADLEQETTLEKAILKLYDTKNDAIFWEGCYIHSTSSDTPDLDTLEVMRAQNLCNVLKKIALLQNKRQEEDNDDVGSTTTRTPFTVVYNSAAARPNHGVGRIAQKHQVEDVFRTAVKEMSSGAISKVDKSNTASPPLIFISLRANIFMEELWKKYTRPSILEGEYPLPVNRFTPIYLTSVRDMGKLAGLWIQHHGNLEVHGRFVTTTESNGVAFKIQNVASEKLRPAQIANCFGEAQGTPCKHVNTFKKMQSLQTDFPELWEQILYVRSNHKEKTDIRGLQKQVDVASEGAISMTSFAQFLQETGWGNPELTFEDLRRADTLQY